MNIYPSQSHRHKELLLVIPAYNEEKSLRGVIESLRELDFCDYIIINDGSDDSTASLCLTHHYPCIHLPVNLGLAGALQAGFLYANRQGYRYAAQFDGDGQHLAEYIKPLLREMKKGRDIVIGSRYPSQGMPPRFLRRIGSALISGAIFITTGQKLRDPTSGMRMYNGKMIRLLCQGMNLGPEPDTIAYLMRSGAKVGEVSVIMRERTAGKSYLTALTSFKYMLRMTLSILVIQFVRNKADLGKEEPS